MRHASLDQVPLSPALSAAAFFAGLALATGMVRNVIRPVLGAQGN
jgi:hypothetical protein